MHKRSQQFSHSLPSGILVWKSVKSVDLPNPITGWVPLLRPMPRGNVADMPGTPPKPVLAPTSKSKIRQTNITTQRSVRNGKARSDQLAQTYLRTSYSLWIYKINFRFFDVWRNHESLALVKVLKCVHYKHRQKYYVFTQLHSLEWSILTDAQFWQVLTFCLAKHCNTRDKCVLFSTFQDFKTGTKAKLLRYLPQQTTLVNSQSVPAGSVADPPMLRPAKPPRLPAEGSSFKLGGRTFGSSPPFNFFWMRYTAIENSFWSIFPSAFMSAKALKKRKANKFAIFLCLLSPQELHAGLVCFPLDLGVPRLTKCDPTLVEATPTAWRNFLLDPLKQESAMWITCPVSLSQILSQGQQLSCTCHHSTDWFQRHELLVMFGSFLWRDPPHVRNSCETTSRQSVMRTAWANLHTVSSQVVDGNTYQPFWTFSHSFMKRQSISAIDPNWATRKDCRPAKMDSSYTCWKHPLLQSTWNVHQMLRLKNNGHDSGWSLVKDTVWSVNGSTHPEKHGTPHKPPEWNDRRARPQPLINCFVIAKIKHNEHLKLTPRKFFHH